MKIKITWRDYLAAAVIGEAVAWLILAVANGLRSGAVDALLVLLREKFYFFGILPVILPIGAVLLLAVMHFLARRVSVLLEITKFVLVGALNTFVDLGVLNLLIAVTTLASGFYFSFFKGISFIVAVVNSYFWNKFWTFKKTTTVEDASHFGSSRQFTQFLIVSVIGFLVNVGVASIVVNVIGPLRGVDARLWANIGAVLATLTSLVWNFIGYKFIVFKSQEIQKFVF